MTQMDHRTAAAAGPDLSKPYCFAIMESERDPQGYVPCVIVEGEPGYSALRGSGPHATPWYWGTAREVADELCRKANAERGLTPEDVVRITLSSMAVSRLPRDRR